MVSVDYGSSKNSWKPWRWVWFDMILTMKHIQINFNQNPLTKFTSNSRSTDFKGILPWNIFQMIMKTVPISTKIVISYVMKWDIPLWIDKKSMETETTTWSEFPNGGKAIAQQIIPSKERNKPNRTACITVWGLSRKINHLSKVVWDYKSYNRVHHIYQFQQNRLTSPHDGQKHTSRCIDQENPIYVRWNRTKNSAYIQRRWLTEENKIRCCVK